jgi:hypothetical protein
MGAEGGKVSIAEGGGEGGRVGVVRGGRAADQLCELGAANTESAEKEENLFGRLGPHRIAKDEKSEENHASQQGGQGPAKINRSQNREGQHLQDGRDLCRRHISHPVQEPPGSAKAMIEHFHIALEQAADLSKRVHQALEVIHLMRETK